MTGSPIAKGVPESQECGTTPFFRGRDMIFQRCGFEKLVEFDLVRTTGCDSIRERKTYRVAGSRKEKSVNSRFRFQFSQKVVECIAQNVQFLIERCTQGVCMRQFTLSTGVC